MSSVHRIFPGLLIVALTASAAQAGPNGGGTLFLHDAGPTYTVGPGDNLCGMGLAPASCPSADTQIVGSSPDDWRVWEVYAAFFESVTPRLKGVSFGISYEETELAVMGWGPCVGDLNNGAAEVQFGDWPHPNSGTSITFQFTQTHPLVECYWFAGYQRSDTPTRFRLIENPDPDVLSSFIDDGAPPIEDPVIGFGSIGFGLEGHALCPDPLALGACCDLKEATCTILTALECNGLENHNFMGFPACDPMPCPTVGPCCMVESGTCELLAPADCRAGGNLFIGLAGQTCESDPATQCGSAALGACCDGQTCTVTFREDCAPPTIWVPKQPCHPDTENPCLLTWGACCIDDVCYIRNPSTCPNLLDFHPGTPCMDNGGPCLIPVEPATWGKIKNLYR